MFKLKFILAFALLFCRINYGSAQKRVEYSTLRWADFQGKHYLICEVDPHKYNISAYNKLPGGKGTYTFAELEKHDKNLLFAINGGMYEKDLSPVGLFISESKTVKDINLNEGTGNFYQLKPNGVFLIDHNNTPYIITSDNYSATKYKAKLATQSGPMLLINGAFNTNFKEGSTNVNLRNAVGITKNGNVVFVISKDLVNFYEFAQFFKTGLGCDNALYLDGVVSQCFAPELQTQLQTGIPLGTFLVVSRKN